MHKYVLIIAVAFYSTPLHAAKGKRYVYSEISFLKEIDYYNSYCLMLNGGFEYIKNPLRSFGGEINVWQYFESGYRSTGVGIRPTVKYYLWRTATYRIFFEIKGGVIYMSRPFPDGGSNFNFTLTGSAGSDLRLTDRMKIALAFRYSHMSNWDLWGADNNPTWDGLGGAAGLIWNLR